MLLTTELREHLKYLKKKDEIAIKKVESRINNSSRFNRKFFRKVDDIYEAFKLQIPSIANILKEYIDNPVVETIFNVPFSDSLVYSVLMEQQFVAMLMCNSLLKRTANLSRESEGQLKLRVYIAILNYDRYKKSKWPRRNNINCKRRQESKGEKN